MLFGQGGRFALALRVLCKGWVVANVVADAVLPLDSDARVICQAYENDKRALIQAEPNEDRCKPELLEYIDLTSQELQSYRAAVLRAIQEVWRLLAVAVRLCRPPG